MIKLFDKVRNPNTTVVNCSSGLEEAAEKILQDLPSFTTRYFCENCRSEFTEKRVVGKIHLEKWEGIEEAVENYANQEIHECPQCKSLATTIGTIYSDFHIFLCPTFSFEGESSEKGTILNTIPLRLKIQSNLYVLTGVIAYEPPQFKSSQPYQLHNTSRPVASHSINTAPHTIQSNIGHFFYWTFFFIGHFFVFLFLETLPNSLPITDI